MAKLLITGITGFIGREVLKELLPLGHEIWALIRPGTAISRYQAFEGKIAPAFIDLADIQGLKAFLAQHDFEIIVHIGALRGGRKANRKKYYQSNVGSTQQFVDYALKRETKLIFCSSVGVFGAIPSELPANAQSSKNADNYYHYTKIECEKIIGKAVLHGLKAMIIRPSITYGRGDKGFPYQLVKLVAGYRFPLIKKQIWIHLCHIDALVDAFVWAVKNDFKSGLSINVADREPVRLGALVDFISRQLHRQNYPRWLSLDRHFYAIGESISRFLKNELFISRFELISKSWFYDVLPYYTLMEEEGKQPHYSIPGIQLVIDYYKGK